MLRLALPVRVFVGTIISSVFICTGTSAATSDYSFSGRWRMDTASIKGDIKPIVFKLADGIFKRDANQSVKADGNFHHIVSDGYVDEQSILVESDHAIKEVDRIRDKLAYVVEYVISSDGNILTWHVASYTGPSGQAVTGITVQRRVGLVEKQGHLISGKWERVSVAVDSKSDWLLKLDAGHFSWRREDGTGYEAIVGGAPVKMDGDNSGALAQITRPRPDTIVETDLSALGKPEVVLSMQLLPDKATIRGETFNPKDKTSVTFYLHRISG